MGRFVATAEAIASGTALKTILQIAAGSGGSRPKVKAISITMDSTSATATPVLVRLQRQTTAGTGGSTVTPVLVEQADGTPNATALKGPAGTWTGEPTAGDIVETWYVPPTSGLVLQYPLGDEIVVANSGRIAIVVTAGAAVNVTASIRWEE
jgi:hypothetical protein